MNFTPLALNAIKSSPACLTFSFIEVDAEVQRAKHDHSLTDTELNSTTATPRAGVVEQNCEALLC